MLNLKKTTALLCTSLFLMQGIAGLNFKEGRAEAATYRTALQDIMSRPYPHLFGNQFEDKGISSTTISRIAKDLDMVAINKSGDLFVDKGANIDIAKKIRSLNSKVKVLQYVNLVDVWDYQSTTYPWMKSNGAFLYDDSGKAIHPYASSYGTHRWAGNPVKTSWQDYYANHAKSIVNQGMDGIFSDNWFRTNFQRWNINSSRFASLQNGWESMGKKTKSAIGSSKILLGNGPAYKTFQSRDISMIEMRNAPNSTAFNEYLKMSDEAASYGQANIDSTEHTFTGSTYMKSYDSILGFSLPACLLTDNIFGFSNRDRVWSAIEKVGRIGSPKGARYRKDSVWQRDFTGGKVVFNDTSSTRTISVPSGYKDLNGSSVSKVTLNSYRGVILKGNSSTSTSTSTSTSSSTSGSIPTAPSNFAVTNVVKASSGHYFINVTWKDNSSNETGFELHQSLGSTSNFGLIKTPAANSTKYGIDIGKSPTKGTRYLKVYSYNSSGRSQASNTVSTNISY